MLFHSVLDVVRGPFVVPSTYSECLIVEECVDEPCLLNEPLRSEATLQDGRIFTALPHIGRMRINEGHGADGEMQNLPALHDAEVQLEHSSIASCLRAELPEGYGSW